MLKRFTNIFLKFTHPTYCIKLLKLCNKQGKVLILNIHTLNNKNKNRVMDIEISLENNPIMKIGSPLTDISINPYNWMKYNPTQNRKI